MSTLDRMAEALISSHIRSEWSTLTDSQQDAYRDDVRLVLRMAADEIDESPVGELYGAASAARLLREIADEDILPDDGATDSKVAGDKE